MFRDSHQGTNPKEWQHSKVVMIHLELSIHLGISISDRIAARGINLDRLFEKANEIMNGIAAENHLENSKHEKLVQSNKQRGKKKQVNWVKWSGIIIDESLTFKEQWKSRMAKAQNMLPQSKFICNSQWGISATS